MNLRQLQLTPDNFITNTNISFDILQFRPNDIGHGVMAQHMFPNNFGVSVVQNGAGKRGLYGNIENDTFEVAILEGQDADSAILTYSTHLTDDVLGYQTIDKVTNIMRQVYELKKNVT